MNIKKKKNYNTTTQRKQDGKRRMPCIRNINRIVRDFCLSLQFETNFSTFQCRFLPFSPLFFVFFWLCFCSRFIFIVLINIQTVKISEKMSLSTNLYRYVFRIEDEKKHTISNWKTAGKKNCEF